MRVFALLSVHPRRKSPNAAAVLCRMQVPLGGTLHAGLTAVEPRVNCPAIPWRRGISHVPTDP